MTLSNVAMILRQTDAAGASLVQRQTWTSRKIPTRQENSSSHELDLQSWDVVARPVVAAAEVPTLAVF